MYYRTIYSVEVCALCLCWHHLLRSKLFQHLSKPSVFSCRLILIWGWLFIVVNPSDVMLFLQVTTQDSLFRWMCPPSGRPVSLIQSIIEFVEIKKSTLELTLYLHIFSLVKKIANLLHLCKILNEKSWFAIFFRKWKNMQIKCQVKCRIFYWNKLYDWLNETH